MTKRQMTAIKFLHRLTNGSMDVGIIGGREYSKARRALVLLLCDHLPPSASLEDVDNAIQQAFSLKGMTQEVRRWNLASKHARIVNEGK